MAALTPSTASTTSKFIHCFSGISVWLEPCPSQTELFCKEMDYLSNKCGGFEAGMYRFVPHCTLLYNTSLDAEGLASCSKCSVESTGNEGGSGKRCRRKIGEEMLQQCISAYHNLNLQNSTKDIQMIPTCHYYFPYPKEADDGKGFGCAISLLILETTPALKALFDVVKTIFPPDERHSRRNSNMNVSGNGKEGVDSDYNASQQGEVEFRPHLALVYAPENHESVTRGWLKEYTEQMEEDRQYLQWIPTKSECDAEMSREDCNGTSDAKANGQEKEKQSRPAGWNARYLSLWSTEGTLDEWFPIAKIDLLTPT